MLVVDFFHVNSDFWKRKRQNLNNRCLSVLFIAMNLFENIKASLMMQKMKYYTLSKERMHECVKISVPLSDWIFVSGSDCLAYREL